MKEFVYRGKPQRLSKITAEHYPLFSYNAIIKLIKDKELRVDGVKVGDDVIVNDGSVVRCYAKDMRLKEVFRDENLLIAYKPKGLKSEGDVSAESIVREYEKTAVLCHRLDTNTDGLLIFALDERAENEIARGFREGYVEKIYEARVYGKVRGDTVYRDYLWKNAKEGKVRIFSEKREGAVPVEAAVKVIGYDDNSTLVEVAIHNGKTHQIRAQLAAHGHFILGDGKYGRDDINAVFGVKKQQLTAKKLVFSFDEKSFLYYLNGKNIEL
ncbi:MAG: RluA family pseudouridine synthase [Christensenellaceae bacterium]|nr:RluA family pseudouridine synthase [Christensenellaceae bacterium]